MEDGIVNFLEKYSKENRLLGVDMQVLKSELPLSQYQELIITIQQDYIEKINLLKLDLSFAAEILASAYPCTMHKDEVIYRKGDPSSELYLILNGEIHYMNKEGHEVSYILLKDKVFLFQLVLD